VRESMCTTARTGDAATPTVHAFFPHPLRDTREAPHSAIREVDHREGVHANQSDAALYDFLFPFPSS
jgi:hypothetical protein